MILLGYFVPAGPVIMVLALFEYFSTPLWKGHLDELLVPFLVLFKYFFKN